MEPPANNEALYESQQELEHRTAPIEQKTMDDAIGSASGLPRNRTK